MSRPRATASLSRLSTIIDKFRIRLYIQIAEIRAKSAVTPTKSGTVPCRELRSRHSEFSAVRAYRNLPVGDHSLWRKTIPLSRDFSSAYGRLNGTRRKQR